MNIKAIVFVVFGGIWYVDALYSADQVTIIGSAEAVRGVITGSVITKEAFAAAIKSTAVKACLIATASAAAGAAIGYYPGKWIGRWSVKDLPDEVDDIDVAVEVRALSEAQAAIQLDYALYAFSALSTSQPHAILDDIVSKTRALLDAETATQEQLNSCLRWAVLMAGVREGLDLLRNVIAAGADVNCVDAYGNTPIALAAHFCVPRAVEELLRHEVNLQASDDDSMHPAAYARQLFVAVQTLLPSDEAFALRAGYRSILEMITEAKMVQDNRANEQQRRESAVRGE